MRNEVSRLREKIRIKEGEIISEIKTHLINIGFKRTLGNSQPIKIHDFEFENENELLDCLSKYILRKYLLSDSKISGFDFLVINPHNDAKILLHEYSYFIINRQNFKRYLIEMVHQISKGNFSFFESDPNYSLQEFEIMKSICNHFSQKTLTGKRLTGRRSGMKHRVQPNPNQDKLSL